MGSLGAVEDAAPLLLAAESAVEEAAGALRRGRGHVGALIRKGDHDFATAVDVQIERLVRRSLARATPDIPFLGEEEGAVGRGAPRTWVLDPIDGTANFAHGTPLCSISLALLDHGRPVLGIVDAPFIGERFVAIEGAGAYLDRERIAVATRTHVDPLVGLADFALGAGERSHDLIRLSIIEQLMERGIRLRVHGSAALDLAWLAAGRLHATVMLSNRPWDVSAGVLAIREAGGMVFDEDGEDYGPDSACAIASTPYLRDTVLSIVRTAVESPLTPRLREPPAGGDRA